jgi:choline dehydrogenase-like flavoprotein
VQLEKTKAFPEAGIVLGTIPLDGCTHFEYGTDKYFDCVSRVWTHSVNHPLRGNNMGPSGDKAAVVDPEIKAYVVIGLRVFDASVTPFIVSGNANAATIMRAEKRADMIKHSHTVRKL